jgi:septal ring factor EnvC (AmiA/AmiB activator)
MAKFDVLREHLGDRFYKEGETREVSEAAAGHLIKGGVLAPHDPKREKRVALTIDELQDKREIFKSEIAKLEADRDAIKKQVDGARAEAEKTIEEMGVSLENEITSVRKELEERRDSLSAEIEKLAEERKAIDQEVAAARAAADGEIAAIRTNVEKAKADAAAANKAETNAPKNK